MEMPFGLSVRTGPRNHKLDEPGPDPPWEGAIWGEGAWELCKNGRTDQFATWVVNSDRRKHKFNRIRQVANTTELVLPLQLRHVSTFNDDTAEIEGLRDVAMATICHLANMIEPSVCGSDAVSCQTTITTCSLYNWHMAYLELHNNTVLSTDSQTHCIIS